MSGDSPPDDGHNGRTKDDKRHQDGRPARMQTHDIVVPNLHSLEESDFGSSQEYQVRSERPVGGEEKVESEEEWDDELEEKGGPGKSSRSPSHERPKRSDSRPIA